MKLTVKLWIGIGGLIILSPLGLLLPEYFKAGPAWGEWGTNRIWNALIPDYAFKGWEKKGLGHLSFAYIMSAAIGALIVALLALIIGKILAKKGD